jgi:hypothetical protein
MSLFLFSFDDNPPDFSPALDWDDPLVSSDPPHGASPPARALPMPTSESDSFPPLHPDTPALTPSRTQSPSPIDPDASAVASIKSHIKSAFALVTSDPSNEWARAFLFDTSPAASAHMLTNPAALKHAVTTRAVDTVFSTGDNNPPGLFDLDVDAEILAVPAFNAGDLSVGVIAHQIAPAAGHSPTSTSSRKFVHSVGRIVSNHATGEILIVKATDPSDNPAAQVQVIHMRHCNTRVRERLVMVCDPTLFYDGRLEESVLLSSHVRESRFCPLCGIPPTSSCACKFLSQPPSHPFDFTHEYGNYRSHFGKYMGKATTTIVAPTNNAPLASLGHRSSASESRHLGVDADTDASVNGLTAQFLCLQLPSSSHSHSILTRPHRRYLQAPLMAQLDLNIFAAENPGADMHRRISSVLRSFVLHVHASPTWRPPCGTIVPCLAEPSSSAPHPLCDENLHWDTHGSVDNPATAPMLPLLPSSPNSSVSLYIEDEQAPQCPPLELVPRSPTPSIFVREHDLDGMDIDRIVDSAFVPPEAPLLTHFSNDIPKPGILPSMLWPPESETPVFKEHVTLRCAVDVKPAVGRSKKFVTADAAALLARDAARQEKNRLAAARSNARRKAMNDGLKRAVVAARNEVSVLRAREGVLRDENCYLRDQIEKQGHG